jgi:23S rRNA pseudouridine2605 synthase
MTSRSNPGRGRQRSSKPSPKPKADERPGARADGTPHSKRFGKRPPKAVREGGSTERPKRTDERRFEGGRKAAAPSGRDDRPATRRADREGGERKPPYRKPGPGKGGAKERSGSYRGRPKPEPRGEDDGSIRLNRYLAMSGVASRRDADALIKAGVVTVNGQVVTELGTKVKPTDKVHYGGQRLSRETKRYVLLNKPKDFLTTTEDPRDRRTVMALVEQACAERIYPVGRLDRNTTGLLLLTNDGDLAKKLTHPSHGAEKIYHVTLDKSVTKADLDQLVEGVPLEDGPARADEARYVEGASRREVGLKLHMGRNRVVRRMFEALGYEVVKLDRVVFAGLTKKDLPRGKWRHLSEKEVLFLTKRK